MLFVRRTTWSTPCSRATSIVRSVEPSSMTSHSTVVEALDLAREIAQRDGEGLLLVQAGDLDDQLHGAGRTVPSGVSWRARSLTRRSAGIRDSSAGARSRRPTRWPRPRSPSCCACFLVGFLVYPTYPNYDSYYSLLWGREVLDLQAPFFEGFRVPTEHPLAIAAGALLSLLGQVGDRVWVGMTLATFLWLVWGIYRLGRVAFTPLIGALAALLLLTRFDFAFLAARGYIDVPYMAMVVWAAVLEATRPKRGWPVFLLLGLAGLLRPGGVDPQRPLLPVDEPPRHLGGASPLRRDDRRRAADLGRRRLRGHRRPAVLAALHELVGRGPRPPAHAGGDPVGAAGFLLATSSSCRCCWPRCWASASSVWAAPRRAVMPLVLLFSGVGTFVLIGVAGLSVIERYLIVAALALLVFAAVGVGGFTMLRPGRLRTGWMTASAVLRARRRDLHRHARRRDQAHQRAAVPRRRARVARERAAQAGGHARAALRAADRAQPQARARRALDPRPAARPRARRAPTRTAAQPAARRRRSTSRAASRSSATPSRTRSTRPRSRSRRTAGGAIATQRLRRRV